MKKLFLLPATIILLVLCPKPTINAQGVGINNTGAPPDPSAVLDASSTNKGFLLPRLTTVQMNAIVSPAVGLIVYNTDCNTLDYWNGGGWVSDRNTGTLNAPNSISGNLTPCPNVTGMNYLITSVAGATSYNWTVPSGAAIISGQGDTSVAVNFGTNSGNICVTASNACGTSNASCVAITLDTSVAAPAASNNTSSATQIVWNWNAVAGAAGYKYNTVNDYLSATDNGTGTSYTQTGLSCGTGYTLYVWAYNVCGYSSGSTTLVQATSSCCSDGTGGAITHYTDGNNVQWTVHTFTGSGTFTPNCPGNVEVLVVAGGGGAGLSGGGGGGGGFSYDSNYAVTATPYAVTVGSGGAGGPGSNGWTGNNGGNSVFGTLTALGGGAGGGGGSNGQSGGSGGGGGSCGGCTSGGGSGTNGQGNNGGSNSGYGGNPYPSGGGGGAGAAGQNCPSPTQGGAGGAGLSSSISGSVIWYAGGGGGEGGGPGGNAGAGGTGGGGAGCNTNGCTGANGTANTGGGGGGGGQGYGPGGAGGAGVVIISYPTP